MLSIKSILVQVQHEIQILFKKKKSVFYVQLLNKCKIPADFRRQLARFNRGNQPYIIECNTISPKGLINLNYTSQYGEKIVKTGHPENM